MGCRKPTVTNWDVDLSGPIVNSKLNIKNFLGDSLFDNSAGLLKLHINRELAFIKVDSLIKLPDTTITQQFFWPSFATTTLNPGQNMPFLPPSPLQFNINNGVALKHGVVRKGMLMVEFSNTVSGPLHFIYRLPGVKKGNAIFEISEDVPPGNNSLIKQYPLDGYYIDLTAGGAAQFNTLIQSYSVSVRPDGQPVQVSFGKGVTAKITYKDIIPQYVKGYFGQQTVDLNLDTVQFNVFNNFSASNFLLHDATFNFNILNQFGAEFNGSLNNIVSINTPNNNTVALNAASLSGINLNRAYDVNGQINATVKQVALNKNNSNILPFLSNLPNKITYGGQITINPLGNTSAYNDFAYYNTGIKIYGDITIPLKFNADAFYLQSEVPINLSNLSQVDNVNYGNIIVNFRNGYPFDVLLQVYLEDENNTIIDSLFVPGQNIIPKGALNSLNYVQFPNIGKLAIPFNKEKMAHIKQSKKALLKAKLLMPPNPPDIHLMDTYEIDVALILEVNYNVRRK